MAVIPQLEPVEIPAGVIQLRPFEAEFDAMALQAAARDASIARYSPSVARMSSFEAAHAGALDLADWSGGTSMTWAVKEITSSTLMGKVGIHNIDAYHRTGEIGYWLLPEFRGRGYITAAVGAASRFAFRAVGIERLNLIHAVENGASCAVAARCGFAHEATLRLSGVVGSEGERVDEHIHGRLAGD